jgi:NAD(P)-dependent dehydrogenase (short-subunit alcohol dehydrogenase family)
VDGSTKNAPAPGKGMSCYSVAKAAVVQLGRIATLELAQYGIRVNTVHPDAVFDTGLWTQEILETRSKAYGLTVDQVISTPCLFERRRVVMKPTADSKRLVQCLYPSRRCMFPPLFVLKYKRRNLLKADINLNPKTLNPKP